MIAALDGGLSNFALTAADIADEVVYFSSRQHEKSVLSAVDSMKKVYFLQ